MSTTSSFSQTKVDASLLGVQRPSLTIGGLDEAFWGKWTEKAIDAFDEFSRFVLLMKGHIQFQAVQSQVSWQQVRGGPGHIFPQIGSDQPQALVDNGYAHKEGGRPKQFLQALSL